MMNPCFNARHPRTALATVLLGSCVPLYAQQDTTTQQLKQLTEAVEKTQAQLAASQRQLIELQTQLRALQARVASESATEGVKSAQTTASGVDELRERQAIQEAQIATHEQAKVESESKYPLKLTGLILANASVNTGAVDLAVVPTLALGGSGSTAISLRQSILGVDARGPHVFGAATRADVRVDFFGSALQGTYNDVGGILRLRTAHAALDWRNTEAFFQVDRPILSPNVPTSLTAVAEPALAWSGNLWNWVPQAGVRHDFVAGKGTTLRVNAALTDVPDPYTPVSGLEQTSSLAEASRWPGTQLRLAVGGQRSAGGELARFEVGAGGYFSPHRAADNERFDAWAGTLDLRASLPAHLSLSGSAYRGQALGGLGGGGYKDYVYRLTTHGTEIRVPDDVGGWAQLKELLSSKVELNLAYGTDNVFARQLRPYAATGSATPYQDIARNRTLFTNVICSPSAYLLFSAEYRRIQTSPVIGPTWTSNVIGLAAGYKF